jgi:hypothetical protein
LSGPGTNVKEVRLSGIYETMIIDTNMKTVPESEAEGHLPPQHSLFHPSDTTVLNELKDVATNDSNFQRHKLEF